MADLRAAPAGRDALTMLWLRLRPLLLTLTAAASFVTAAFLVGPVPGFVILGLVATGLDWLWSGDGR